MMIQRTFRTFPSFAVLPVVLGVSGCFSIHNVDQGPWVIDDFEDGDLKPADPTFGPWTCATFNETTAQNCSYGLDAGDLSASSLFLDFTVDDSPDGNPQEGGAELYTGGSKPENLSGYGDMVLSAKLVSAGASLPSSATLEVQLGCSAVPADDGTLPGTLYVVQGVPYTGDWQTFTLPTANFGSPPWIATHLLGGPTACLQRVDSISFAVEPEVPDGQSATIRLNLDDIYFQ